MVIIGHLSLVEVYTAGVGQFQPRGEFGQPWDHESPW
jgi:hypothetical protein